MADAHKNFAYSTILTAPSPATSGTSTVVQSGDGAKFPTAPFNATIWPVGVQPTTANAEIVRVTVVSTDTLTITRAQESSSARTVVVGDQIAATITAKTLTDAEAPPESAITTTDITTNNVTSTKHGFAPKSPGDAGKFLNGAATPAYTIPGDATTAYFESGCVWSGDAYASTLNASMTSGVVWIAGKRLTVASISAHAMTASKDMYIDFTDNGDGTAVPTYITTTANNAASPALTSGGIRNAIIVTGATNINSVASVNQGQETKLLPIASSRPYAVTDSLGNIICPRDPDATIIGHAQTTSNLSTASTSVQASAILICPVIVPTGRKIRLSFSADNAFNSSASGFAEVSIWDGVAGSGTQLKALTNGGVTAAGQAPSSGFVITTPAANSKTYSIGFRAVVAGTATVTAGATDPISFIIELL